MNLSEIEFHNHYWSGKAVEAERVNIKPWRKKKSDKYVAEGLRNHITLSSNFTIEKESF